MASIADIPNVLQAFRNSLKIIQDARPKNLPLTRLPPRENYEAVLENYCASKNLRWNREVSENSARIVYHMHGDYFRVDVHIIHGVVGDVWVFHQFGSGHLEPCPHIARALRSKNMVELHKHMTGFLRMYGFIQDKSQRSKFFGCLSKLEADLTNAYQQFVKLNLECVPQILKGQWGLISPRRDGIPISLCFFITQSDFLDHNNKMLETSFCAISGRRLGTWASVNIKESSVTYSLPSSSLARQFSQSADGVLLFDYGNEGVRETTTKINAQFVLELDKPMFICRSILDELVQETGFEIPVKTDSRPGLLLELLENAIMPEKSTAGGTYFAVIAGHHHKYVLAAADVLAETVQEIPFIHPTHVEGCLRLLRRQAALNKLISTCIRTTSQTSVVAPFEFHVMILSDGAVRIRFLHPVDNISICQVHISLLDPVSPVCSFNDHTMALCSDALMSSWLKRSFSIPIMFRSMMEHFVKNYVPSVPRVPAETAVVKVPEHTTMGNLPVVPLEALAAAPVLPVAAEVDAYTSEKTTNQFPPPSPNPPLSVKLPKPRSTFDQLLSSGPKNRAKDLPMDADIHSMRMKQLYEKNKKSRANREFEEELPAESVLPTKSKKRKVALESPTLYQSPFVFSNMKGDATETTEVIRQEPGVIKIRNVSEDSPHGSPTITIKLPVNKPSHASDAPILQSLILSKDREGRKEKKRSKLAEQSPDARYPEPKKLKKDTELEALLKKGGGFSTSPPKTTAKYHVPSSVAAKYTAPTTSVSSTFSAKIASPTVFSLVHQKSTVPFGAPGSFSKSQNPTAATASGTKSSLTPQNSFGVPKSPVPPKSPAVTAAKSPLSASSKQPFYGELPTKKTGMPGSSPKSRDKHSPGKASKSPLPPPVPATAPLFSIPKTPSLSTLPRIPKKTGTPVGTTPTTSTPPVKSSLAPPSTAASTSPGSGTAGSSETSSVAALLVNQPSPSPRPPLLPTPDMEPLPLDEKDEAAKAFAAAQTLMHRFMPPPGPPPYYHFGIPPPKLVEKEKLQTVNVAEQQAMEEADKRAKGFDEGHGTSGVSTPPPAKGRPRSLSAILDRLKSRVEPPDGSHDSSDVQDGMFQGTSDQSELSKDALTMEPSAPGSSVTASAKPSEIDISASSSYDSLTIEDATRKLEHAMRQQMHASTSDKSKPFLVPYSSGDSSSDSEEDKTPTASKEREPARSVADLPGSPEILERHHVPPPPLTLPTATESFHLDVPTEPSIQSILARSPGEERTSPIILDDAMLDAAFFTEDRD